MQAVKKNKIKAICIVLIACSIVFKIAVTVTANYSSGAFITKVLSYASLAFLLLYAIKDYGTTNKPRLLSVSMALQLAAEVLGVILSFAPESEPGNAATPGVLTIIIGELPVWAMYGTILFGSYRKIRYYAIPIVINAYLLLGSAVTLINSFRLPFATVYVLFSALFGITYILGISLMIPKTIGKAKVCAVEERILALNERYQRGLVTEEEYHRQRSEILKKL